MYTYIYIYMYIYIHITHVGQQGSSQWRPLSEPPGDSVRAPVVASPRLVVVGDGRYSGTRGG